MIVGVCSLSLCLIAVDTTAVNLALPLIARGLHATVSGLQWTVAAYTVTTASLMLAAGGIGDRFGRRAVLQAGLAVFTLASLGCSLAPGAGWLIAFRALQGAGGAALAPMSVGIIAATFTDPAARARALGIWISMFGVGMAGGPVIGGVLAGVWGWRSVFWITIAPGVAAIVLAARVIPRRPAGTVAAAAEGQGGGAAGTRRLDVPGQVLVIAFLGCLTYGIIAGPADGWRSPAVLSVFAGSAAALGLLVTAERRRPDPLIELRAFRSVPFSGALVITLCTFAGQGGFLFLATLYLQDYLHLPVLQAGLRLLPLAVATLAGGLAATRVMGRRGARWPLLAAGLALGASCLALAADPAPSWLLLLVAYAAFGVGYGSVNTVISAVGAAGLPPAQAGVAGGLTSAGRQAGQSLGVSVVGSVFAAGLHAAGGAGLSGLAGLAAASHPAWLVIAACGLVVVPLGLVATSRRAIRTAAGALAGVETLTREPGPAAVRTPGAGVVPGDCEAARSTTAR